MLLTKDFLHEWYVRKGLSTWAIEKRFGASRSQVHSALKRHHIPIRNLSQSHIRYARQDFSGNQLEKAYLLGFAIGDLRVRKLNKNGSTISIGCGSTKPAQIELIENLLSPYGRIWKGRPDRRGAVNIEAFLNTSFSFLLPHERKYQWCADSAGSFFSFLAGFTDAEGSFYISGGKGFAAWGNYDVGVLRFIQEGLATFGVRSPKLCKDSLRGWVGSHGYARNKDYWHLSISRKSELQKLMPLLKHRLQHADKRRTVEKVAENLILRELTHV